ncbi:MAG TPA: hypothetical protein VN622_14965 [Clostridia bacterium]|nr:hypothetical protein [Clostridia bacterium]
MSSPGTLFRPYQKLVSIRIKEREFQVAENNMLLRCLQYLAAEDVAHGRFCWNEECQYCRITYDMGEGTPTHTALSCKLMVKEGMRVKDMQLEVRYCLRSLNLTVPQER